ncbi:MAG TPA: polysaccharide biosynthesis tyrosine autokinase [Paraburkholderia sp.]|nr:polysaccharide biosynthesis tyrosine autokinase [Paraburkholderia sp.]
MNSSYLGHEPIRVRDHDDTFSASDLWRLIVDNVWLVCLIIVAITGAATLYAYVATPSYAADALVKVDFPTPNELGVSSRGGDPVTPTTLPDDAEMQIMQSRRVLLPVIAKYKQDIAITPNEVPFFGRIGEMLANPGQPMPAFLGLKSFAWGGEDVQPNILTVPARLQDKELTLRATEGGGFQLLDPDDRLLVEGRPGERAEANGVTILLDKFVARPGTQFTVVRYSEFRAIDRFLKKLKVMEQTKESGVVQIIFENESPRLAQLITNAIADNYVAANIAQRREEASTTREFIDGELPKLRQDLSRAETALSDYRSQVNTMEPTSEASSYLQGSLDLDRQIAQLNMQRAQVAARFAPGTREVQTLDQQLALLTAEKQRFESRFKSLPDSQRKSADLTRDAKVAEDIYVAMLNKSSELSVTRAGTLGNVHIIDTALLPTSVAKPKRLIVMGGGLAAGIILSVLFVFTRKQLSRTVENPHAIERHLSLPVFGAVLFSGEQARLDRANTPSLLSSSSSLASKSRANADDARGQGYARAVTYAGRAASRFLLSTDADNDMAIETLRTVRASLQLDIADARNNVLAIAGATPGTGKTFIASNLAVLHAQAGKRVLLIDSDMRRGRIAGMFGLAASGGLAEVLSAQMEPRQAIRSVGVPGLSVITSGEFPVNPSELLSTSRLQMLLEDLGPQYDLIIIDTPAVLAVSDANMVASHAGSTVLVVRPAAQSESELEDTVKRLDRSGGRVVGIIFNAVPRRRSEKRTYAYASAYTSRAPQA